MKQFLRKYLGINNIIKDISNIHKYTSKDKSKLEQSIFNIKNIESNIKKGEYIKISDKRIICLDIKFDKNIPIGYEEIIKTDKGFIGKIPVFEVPNIICGGNWVEILLKSDIKKFNNILNSNN